MIKPALFLLLGSLSFSLAFAEPEHATTSTEHAAATRGTDGSVKGPDGILRVKGVTMYLKDGQLTRVNNELKLKEGLVARPNGEVVLGSGQTVTLVEGQMITLDGKQMAVPTGLGSTAPGSSTNAPDTGAKTQFGNGK